MGAPDAEPVTAELAPKVRLHISPFNPELADHYLTPPVRALATDISFHSTQTDPVRGFGFVDLPVEEATKLKQKLNGMVLKGAKVKIEEAKPDKKRKRIEPPPPCDESRPKKIPKKDRNKDKKKEKKEAREVIPGHELEEGRHIKRGWEDKGALKTKKERKAERKALKKAERAQRRLSSTKSIKYKEMRFKTVLPPNATPLAPKGRVKNKDKYNKNKRKKTTVVNEFEYARKPAIIGTNTDVAQPHVEYEDGVGWVDAEGRVVEGESEVTKRKRAISVPSEQVSGSDSSSEDVNEESSVVSDSSSEEDDEGSSEDDDDTSDGEEDSVAPPTETSATSDQDAEKKEIHPLEALFKRPLPTKPTTTESLTTRTKPAPIDTSFSFFDGNANDADEEMQEDAPGDTSLPTLVIPQTPHTKRDLEWRALRSGAPTPDTAAVGQKFRFPLDEDEDNDDDDDDDDDDREGEEALENEIAAARTNATSAATVAGDGDGAEQPREESAFRKWFFDNRGDLNRSWKKRRREERKANRQRENRRASRKLA